MTQLELARWRAVEDRDVASSGLFVYGVRTTGVFCRPGCSSKRPLRRNVEFFETSHEAAAAGFRACRRCHPDHERVNDPTTAALIAACRRFERRTDEGVAEVAREVGLSERHLRRLFSDVVGVPAGTYRRAVRARKLRAALRAGHSVTTAAVASDYRSFRALYEDGTRHLGMTPGRYREGGRGEHIAYTTLRTDLGWVVVGATARGVCVVRIGPDEQVLVEELVNEFAQATIDRDDAALADAAGVLREAARGAADASALPVDVRGTAFQIRVWEALRAIPLGETRTYSEVAQEIGEPRAVRAVASACAANAAALAIPCHRVVRRDGSLGGYRWGIDVKENLLGAEAAHVFSRVESDRSPR